MSLANTGSSVGYPTKQDGKVAPEPYPVWIHPDDRLPDSQATFEDYPGRLQTKIDEEEAVAYEDHLLRRRSTYKYSDPRLRQAVKDGLVQVTNEEATSAFLEDYDHVQVSTFLNPATGERMARLSPKRGNVAYARRWRKRESALLRSLDGLAFDVPVRGSRSGTLRLTNVLMITTTDDRSRSVDESWRTLSYDHKKSRVKLARNLGYDVVSYDRRGRRYTKRIPLKMASVTSKEACEDGYPAPHEIVILERPVLVKRYLTKKNKVRWIVVDESVRASIKGIWPHGYVDVEGVCANDSKAHVSGFEYPFKYLSKVYDFKQATLDDKKHCRIALNTHAWAKLFGYRTIHISQQFKNYLNPERLDSYVPESQQTYGGFWVFNGSFRSSIADYCFLISDLWTKWSSGLPPPGGVS